MTSRILILSCLLSIFKLNAQVGIEAGAWVQPQIYSQIYTEEISGRSVRIPYSMAIGVDAGYNFTDYLGVRSGFVYSLEGERYTLENLAGTEDSYDLNLEYLKVPIYLKFNSDPNQRAGFIAFAGPMISFINNAEITLNEEDPVAVLGDYKRLVLGASGAIGLQLNLDRGGNLNLVWRTGLSLQPIQDEGDLNSYSVNSGLLIAYHYFIQI